MEVWKKIDGYYGVYQISSLGRVRSLDHFCKNRNGSGKQTGRYLKSQKCKKGYLRFSLSKNRVRKNLSAHRLVAIAFIPNYENKPQVNHINGIKNDNRVENLEWCNNSENQIHAIKKGLVKHNKCEKHHNSKLSNKEVKEVRILSKKGITNKKLAEDFNVSQTAMSYILRNKTYINI